MSKELPADWNMFKLGEVCERITKGSTPTTYGFKFQNEGIRFLKIENVKFGKILVSSIKDFISPEAHNYQRRSQLEVGDILFSIAGTIGEMCTIRGEHLPANTNQAFAIIRGAQKVFELKFLQYQLESFVANIKIKARGGAMNNISLEDLKTFDVIIPPIDIQKTIVLKVDELFSELDKGIENLKIAQEQLKVYRQSVLKWAFEGKVTNQHLEDGELPKGWKWVRFDDVTILSTSKHQPEKVEELFYVGLEHINKGAGSLVSSVGFEPIKTVKNKFNSGDILYGKLRPYLNKAYLAEQDGVCSTDILVFKTLENCNSKFLLHLILSSGFVNDMSDNTSGVNLPRVSTKYIQEYPILLPPKDQQKMIVEEIESRLSVVDNMEKTIAQSFYQAESLRQSILKKAFEGTLI